MNFFVKDELDVLFILTNINIKSLSTKKLLFINFLIKMNFVFRNRILIDYEIDVKWKQIITYSILRTTSNFHFVEKNMSLFFVLITTFLRQITFSFLVDCTFRIQLSKTFSKRFTTIQTIIRVISKITNVSFRFDTFVNWLNDFVNI